MSISGLAITARASATTFVPLPTIACARAVSRSATIVISMPRPARRLISAWLRFRTLKTPLPTVPMPRRPTWIGFIPPPDEPPLGRRTPPRGAAETRSAERGGSFAMSLAIGVEEARDAVDRLAQVVLVRQDD